MHILIVEDDEAQRRLLEHFLTLNGHTSCWAATGEAALGLMRTEPIDLVLLDLHLEGSRIQGWDLPLEKMRNPRMRDVPFIVTSGEDVGAIRDERMRDPLGSCVVMLGKPLDLVLLLYYIGRFDPASRPEIPFEDDEPDTKV